MKKSKHTELWNFEADLPASVEDAGVLLGLDGGATSTLCVCVAVPDSLCFQEPPQVLGRGETGVSNRNSIGEDATKLAIETALAEALMKAHKRRSSVQAVCLALSGVDHPLDQQRILLWLREIFPDDVERAVYNDSVAALSSGTLGRLHGCALVAGTGAIAFGATEGGREARAAGVGPILGEQGSGYSIAQAALAAVMRAHDGRGPPTRLTRAILERLELSSPDELIRWTYKDSSWARIASIVPAVKACAMMGDGEAKKVLSIAVKELACTVEAVVTRLKLAGEDGMESFPLVLVGGVLEVDNGWDLFSQLISRILEIFPNARPIKPDVEPAVGASMLAWTICSHTSRPNE